MGNHANMAFLEVKPVNLVFDQTLEQVHVDISDVKKHVFVPWEGFYVVFPYMDHLHIVVSFIILLFFWVNCLNI